MGGGGSRPDPSEQILAAAAQTRLQGEEEGNRIMQNCIASLQKQLSNFKSEMNQDRSWMKSTMETFLSKQSEMKDQHKDMLREMVQKDSFYAQETANADSRHMQQLKAMKEEMERMREGQERTLGLLRDDMRQERERIQREQQAAMEAVRQDIKEDRERSQQDKAMLMETMKKEKELILKRHDDHVHTLKDEMKEERGMMQKNLNERVEAMNQEKQAMAKQHESHVQTLQTTMQEEKQTLQKHLNDRVDSMAEEIKRLEQIYTGQIHTLREDSETMKKEKNEQMHAMKKELTEDKHNMQAAYNTRFQTDKDDNKEEKAHMRAQHTQQMQEIKAETKEDKDRLALTYDRHLQNVREEMNQERQSTARHHEHLMLMVERRDLQFLDMTKAGQNTMSCLPGSQNPSMIQYQQAKGNGQSPPTEESQYENSGNDQPTTVDGRNSPATIYQQQDDLRSKAAGNGIIDHEISRTQMTCQSEPGGSGQMNSPRDPEAEEKKREDTAGKEATAPHHVQTQDPYAMPPCPSQSGQSAIPTPVHAFVDHDSSSAAPPGQMRYDAVYPQRGESVIPPYSGDPAGEAPFGYQAGGENSVGHEAGRMPSSIPQVGRMTPAGHQETSYPINISDTGYEERQFGQRRSMGTEVPQPGLQDLHGPMSPLSSYGVHNRQSFLSGGRGEGVAPLNRPGDAHPQSVGASGTQEAALPPSAQLPHRGTPDSGPLDLATTSASRNREQTESGVTADNPTDVADDEMEDMQSFETLSISDEINQE